MRHLSFSVIHGVLASPRPPSATPTKTSENHTQPDIVSKVPLGGSIAPVENHGSIRYHCEVCPPLLFWTSVSLMVVQDGEISKRRVFYAYPQHVAPLGYLSFCKSSPYIPGKVGVGVLGNRASTLI